MIYPYKCKVCDKEFEIIKPLDQCDRLELCEHCKSELIRIIKPTIHLSAPKVEKPYWSPSLGKMVETSSQERREAKAKGWEEVGNEKPEKWLKPKEVEYD